MDKLSSKCLIIADKALQKGLPLVMQGKEQKPICAKKLSIQEDEGQMDGKVDTEGPEEVGGVERLSCIAMTWKTSLSSTMDRVDHFNGEPVYVQWLESLLSVKWLGPLESRPVAPRCDVWHMVHNFVVDLTVLQ